VSVLNRQGVRADGGSKPSRVFIEVAIAIGWSEEEQCFYAWSPQLDCVRDGDSEDEAAMMCREALEVLIEGLIERNTLDTFLTGHGYMPHYIFDKQMTAYHLADGYIFRQEDERLLDLPSSIVLSGLKQATVETGAAVACV